jgi:hypothetical protein
MERQKEERREEKRKKKKKKKNDRDGEWSNSKPGSKSLKEGEKKEKKMSPVLDL